MRKKLLEKIRVLDEVTREYHKLITVKDVKVVTSKAALLEIDSRVGIIELWFPISQLACDSAGNIYAQKWFFQKYFLN